MRMRNPFSIRLKSSAHKSALALCLALLTFSSAVLAEKHRVSDLKYGAVLFEFYQKKYFEALVEFEYAAARGGIHEHGDYPELLKGGVSLSYGLDRQAKDIFSKLISENTTQEIQNRAWFYLAKMLYLRGDIERSAANMIKIKGTVPNDIEQEYRYLAALVNIKSGHFDEAELISQSFDDDSAYAPYLYFNLGVALGKQSNFSHAIENLAKSAKYADDSEELNRLSDRAHMAIAYLYAQEDKFNDAYGEIRNVSASGVYSNRALLGSGWASVNNNAYREALAPLSILQSRSIAIPEVQEAVLLVPHIYEKLGLMGRAARGFISAYNRYSDALVQLEKARETLKQADILELFVRNLDDMLDESDWFGTAPKVSLNSLSPFLLDLMSDHSFQSVLKELRDLYAIRNNLNNWKLKRNDFKIILASRSRSSDGRKRSSVIENCATQQRKLQAKLSDLATRTSMLDAEDQKRILWILDEIGDDLDDSALMVSQVRHSSGVQMPIAGYAKLVDQNMESLDEQLSKTDKLIEKVESVMLELVNAELDVHEERIKYYRVQSHLAKARILDRSLTEMDNSAGDEPSDTHDGKTSSIPLSKHIQNGSGGDDAS